MRHHVFPNQVKANGFIAPQYTPVTQPAGHCVDSLWPSQNLTMLSKLGHFLLSCLFGYLSAGNHQLNSKFKQLESGQLKWRNAYRGGESFSIPTKSLSLSLIQLLPDGPHLAAALGYSVSSK